MPEEERARNAALPDHVRGLLQPGVELIQTHISYVLLAPHDVYKLKKAVDFGFVDFTSLEKRRAACEAEVRLNRRGCAGAYLGVVAVVRDTDGFRIGEAGQIVDYAVHMKRLPADRMMDRLLERSEVSLDMIGRLARRLADYHRAAERSADITRIGGRATLEKNWRDNLESMRRLGGAGVDESRIRRIETYVHEFFRREAGLLGDRESGGWIRDCHGDLRSDAVCFDPAAAGGICLYDCLEFNDSFRYSDTALDVAFLAMDMEFRGHRDLSDLLVGLYAPLAGDKALGLLLDFYKCYRAVVRGKVESILAAEQEVPAAARTEARNRAGAYFRLAESFAARKRHGAVAVVVMGPSGSGKSVLAGALASRLGALLLSTDLLRREMLEERGAGAPLHGGIYSPQSRESVYAELRRQACAALAERRPVVIDGSFVERRQRDAVLGPARASGGNLLVVECWAPDALVHARQSARASESWSTSEGRWEVYEAQKQRYEPPEELAREERVRIDTSERIAKQIELVTARL